MERETFADSHCITTYPASYQRRLHFYQTIKTEPVVIGDIIGCIIKDIWHFVASSNLYKVFLGVEDIKESIKDHLGELNVIDKDDINELESAVRKKLKI